MRMLVLAVLALSPSFAYSKSPGPELVSMRAEAASGDGRCSVSVQYPQLRGLARAGLQDKVNRFFQTRFRGPRDAELAKAGKAGCVTAYIESVGFDAQLQPSGVLSVKRTRATMRGDGFPGTLVKECYLIDLTRGGRLDPTRWLGPAALAKLSALTHASVQKRFAVHDLARAGFTASNVQLQRGNYSLCLENDTLVVELAPELVDPGERGAVEARIPAAALGGAWTASPLARRLAQRPGL
jgi:hypothetical protein